MTDISLWSAATFQITIISTPLFTRRLQSFKYNGNESIVSQKAKLKNATH